VSGFLDWVGLCNLYQHPYLLPKEKEKKKKKEKEKKSGKNIWWLKIKGPN
jgi:hypothetical protein